MLKGLRDISKYYTCVIINSYVILFIAQFFSKLTHLSLNFVKPKILHLVQKLNFQSNISTNLQLLAYPCENTCMLNPALFPIFSFPY